MADGSSVSSLVATLRALVGQLRAGDRLPSTRTLVREHGVGPGTVQRAVEVLVAEGLVETRPGAGNFVAREARRSTRDVSWQAAALGPSRPRVDGQMGSGIRPVPADAIALHSGYPVPELQAAQLATAALVRAVKDPWSHRAAPVNGLPVLREAFAREVQARWATADVTGDDVVITSGGQSALVAAFRALARPGEVIVMESPTFWGAMAAATEAGLVIAPIASGPDGPDPAELAEVLETHRARVFYAQPTRANPTGRTWSLGTGRGVLDVARERGVFVVEDDWARDLGLAGAPVPPPALVAGDTDGHVVHIRSLTKSLSPSIRVAALVAKGPALQRIRDSRWAVDLYVATPLQLAATDVLSQPAWVRHLTRLAAALDDRERDLRAALVAHAPSIDPGPRPTGGLSLWVSLPDGADARDVAARCLQAGVALSPGDEWYPAEPDQPHLRLGYAATAPANFATAATVLEQCLTESLARTT